MAVGNSPKSAAPIRILTAVPVCDGHDSAVTTINIELARHGIEVIYLGYHQPASAIVRAAIQEDVNVVGLSSYNGGHIVFFKEVVDQLRKSGNGDIPVFGGGGGTITQADERVMKRQGTDRIFFAGTPLDDIMALIKKDYAHVPKLTRKLRGDRALARAITLAEEAVFASKTSRLSPFAARPNAKRSFVVGVAGPGGAGKSTLIDELTSRFLRSNPTGRIALLANDPSHPDSGGAILGDRVSAIYAQDDRVFFRSLATRGSLTGLSAASPAAIEILKQSGEFDLILVESVGVGQESDPFQIFGKKPKLVDATLFVLAPYYGGLIQLQKITLLNGADFVALNKCDHPMAHTAKAEIQARLNQNAQDQSLYPTTAAKHFDPGVDALFTAIAKVAGLEVGPDLRAGRSASPRQKVGAVIPNRPPSTSAAQGPLRITAPTSKKQRLKKGARA
ncbi:cobalamin-dependent protein [Oleiharenicola lentus]|uniref:cobalamin-dependent protein n=1 Tax=Oleiharenicola lentus TaxID=2508720 RepID=UPI003F66D39A